jgi:hypothetical protein
VNNLSGRYCFGFTATREGLTVAQKLALRNFLFGEAGEFHHGDCLGGDSDGHDIAQECGYWIVGHPPLSDALRAFRQCDVVRAARPYLQRDRDIVEETVALIAAPKEFDEQPRGGTWYTVRYARKLGRAIVLILPDGKIKQTSRVSLEVGRAA